eukprot:TRINITY_DN862_c0_g1_i4.p1 TRINITY_DN862_c0_g1~~TRINITY_DN862_c0_g1_i4.p1  ORF type:complete len:214 (+),score=20.98 TRINITY_DN862_c0_g1_i4:59-700(+)
MEENEAQQSPQIQMSSAYVSMAEDQLLIGEPPKINESREMWLRLNQNLALFCAFYSLIVAAVYVVMCSTSGRPTFLVPMLLSLLNYTCSLLVIWRIYPELRKYAGTSRDYRTDPQLNHRERAGSLISYGQLAIVGFLSGIFGVYTIVADVYKEESGWMLWASIIFSFISYGLTRVKEIYCKELYSTILRADEFCWSATFLCSVVVSRQTIWKS